MVIEENNDIGGYYRYWVFNMHGFRELSFIWGIFHIHSDAYDEVKWALAGEKGGAQWGNGKAQSSWRALHLKCRNVFPTPPDYFSFRSESPFRAVPLVSLVESKLIIPRSASLPLLSVLHPSGLRGSECFADMKCWNNSGPTTKWHTKAVWLKSVVCISLQPHLQVANFFIYTESMGGHLLDPFLSGDYTQK